MRTLLITLVICTLAVPALAELQNVRIGGLMEIRGRYYRNAFNSGAAPLRPARLQRLAPQLLPGRSTGDNGITSVWRYDKRGSDWSWVEATTSLSVAADFTDNIEAMIEFYDFTVWGEDFRSDYITGADFRAVTNNDIVVLQSYIKIDEFFDLPLSVKVGRQTMKLGKGFLVSDKTTPTQRLSFDGIRLTYKPIDDLTLDGWWFKLQENSPVEEDGDVDFYGLYGTYTGMEALNLSAYWMLVRDARSLDDGTNLPWLGQWVESAFGVNDYDPTYLNTVGVRAWGKAGGFDYDAEIAYQFGNADAVGQRYVPLVRTPYGDNDAKFDNWGIDVEVGYTFDTAWRIRPFIQGVYFEGNDNSDLNFAQWLGTVVNPFYQGKASIGFMRMFSDLNYCPVLNDNGDMTNFMAVRGGVTMSPTEKFWVMLRGHYAWVDEPFAWPVHVRWGNRRFPILPALSFWTTDSSKDLGFTAELVARYSYSEDLTFILYYGHLWPSEGTRDGSYLCRNMSMFNGGWGKDNVDYVFLWSILKF